VLEQVELIVVQLELGYLVSANATGTGFGVHLVLQSCADGIF